MIDIDIFQTPRNYSHEEYSTTNIMIFNNLFYGFWHPLVLFMVLKIEMTILKKINDFVNRMYFMY